MSRHPTEIMALRHLANELELREHIKAMPRQQYYTPQFIAELDERIHEARKQLHDIQAPLAVLHGLK